MEPVLIICNWCGCEFQWQPKQQSDEHPLYHASCRKNAQRSRGRKRKQVEDLALVGRCPRPFKKVFTSQELAWDWIVEIHPDDDEISVYKCECGATHIGHPRRKLTRAENSARLAAQERRGTPD